MTRCCSACDHVPGKKADEAAKLYQQIVRDYPNSEYVERRRKLNIIGAAIPDPDPIKKDLHHAEAGFMPI